MRLCALPSLRAFVARTCAPGTWGTLLCHVPLAMLLLCICAMCRHHALCATSQCTMPLYCASMRVALVSWIGRAHGPVLCVMWRVLASVHYARKCHAASSKQRPTCCYEVRHARPCPHMPHALRVCPAPNHVRSTHLRAGPKIILKKYNGLPRFLSTNLSSSCFLMSIILSSSLLVNV